MTGCSSQTCGRMVDLMQSEAEHDAKYMEALRKLPPEGRSTLNRMREAAADEASRIESFMIVRLMVGEIAKPWPCAMRKRDDFVGIVRLIDNILGTPALLELLQRKDTANK